MIAAELSQLPIEPAKRYLVSLPVLSEKYGSALNARFRMINLSTSGALLKLLDSKELFKKGDILRLAIELEEINKTNMVSAEIIWVDQNKVGVSFLRPIDVLPKLFELYGR